VCPDRFNSGKEPVEYEEQVWTFRTRETFLFPAGNRSTVPRLSSPSPVTIPTTLFRLQGRLWFLPEVEGAALVQVHIAFFLAVLHLLTLYAPQHVGRYESLSNCYPHVAVCNSHNATLQYVQQNSSGLT